MSGEAFSAEWLQLRANADDRARDAGLVRRLAAYFAGRAPVVNDLGGGLGATRRALGARLPGARWRLLDNDPALLDAAEGDALLADLAQRPEAAFARGPDLVTASAFFDLVSAGWLAAFVRGLAARTLPLYAALTYDGRESWAPAPPYEAEALTAFHADMRRDKGFGAALGPAAHAALVAALKAEGYEVIEGESGWRLARSRDAALIAALAEGAATAPKVREALAPGALAAWRAGRREAETVFVGHRDLLALPPVIP